jgi:uncharacterized integral membrane protein (TIGR00697 family)
MSDFWINIFLWAGMLIFNFSAIILLYRFFGKTGLFVWIPISAIIANIQVLKLIPLFGMEATLGNIVYAGSFLVTDILNEIYGKKEAGKAVFFGFISIIVLTVLMQFSLYFVPLGDDNSLAMNEAFKTLFKFGPQITGASILAFLISQNFDVWFYNFIRKKLPSDKLLWFRNNGSTMISQLIDSAVFSFIAFAGILPIDIILKIFISTYLLKFIVAFVDTPFMYLAKRISKKVHSPQDVL